MTLREALHVLGLSPHNPKPSPDEIKAAWRGACDLHHPDLHPDDPGATERFKRAVEAHEILTGKRDADPEPSASSRPAVDLSRVLTWTLERAADPRSKAGLVDLLGSQDGVDVLQAASRAFLRFAKGVK